MTVSEFPLDLLNLFLISVVHLVHCVTQWLAVGGDWWGCKSILPPYAKIDQNIKNIFKALSFIKA